MSQPARHNEVFSLVGRTALVTGGSRGLGAAIVEHFVKAGARVAFCYLDDIASAEALVARLPEFPVFSMESRCERSDRDVCTRHRTSVPTRSQFGSDTVAETIPFSIWWTSSVSIA